MNEEEKKKERDARYRDRRAYERYDLNAPGGSLKYKGTTIPSEIIDISLGGCCIRTGSRFQAGNLANVEVVVPIHGMILRMVGVTQWMSENNLIGIRFFHASSRSKNQLAGLLTCLVDQSAAEAVTEAMVAAAVDPSADKILNLEISETLLQSFASAQTTKVGQQQAPQSVSAPHLAPEPLAEKATQGTEKKVKSSEQDDWSAVLEVLKDGSRHAGAIIGLSPGGCTVRTAKPCSGGIYARVEVVFHMRGLSFRLAGVVDAVHDKQSVEIHFIEMSSRKREGLVQLLDELRDEGKTPFEVHEDSIRSA
jgi:hypothetical protein